MHKIIFAFALGVCSVEAATTAASSITATPSAMSIAYTIGAAALPAAQSLQIQTNPKGLNFTAAVSGAPYNAAWLLVSATAGVAPATIKVEVNPTGLPAGAYSGTITLTAVSGSQTLTQTAVVTLTVNSAPAAITASPASLSFTYTTGNPIPSPSLTSTFILSSSGSALPATLAVSGAPWLKVLPSGNINVVGLLNAVSLTVDPTGLAPKVYTGSIAVSAPAASNKTLSLSVTLTVNAAPPSVTSTWPAGVIEGSGQSVVTLAGSNFFANSTVAATGFTPASTITVSDGTNSTTGTFLIPVYQSTATVLRLAVASPLPSGVANVAYTQALAAAGGTAPFTYLLAGGFLPTGLSVTNAQITGTPTTAGTYAAVIQVTDSSTPPVSAYSQLQLTIDPAGATSLRIEGAAAPLPLGTEAASFGPVTLTAAGGTGGPYTWSATDLPPGMTLSAAGVLAGSPSTDGSAGPLAATIVSSTDLLVTIPAASLSAAGVLRMTVTTPAPGGGSSNEAQFQIFGPNPQITAVVNSASFAQGTIAPGDVIAIFGLGIGPAALAIFDPTVAPIPTALPVSAPSTIVTVNGTPAPILYTSGTQASVIVPYTTAGSTAQIAVTYGGLSSQAFTVAVAPADPGIYSMASSGKGQGAILNYNTTTGDYSINSNSNAALRGSVVILYITGAGATTSAADNTLIPASPAVTPVQTPTVTIGGQGATLLGAQAPAGSVPGLMQLNVTVPANVTIGNAVPVIVTIGGVASQSGLTMAVK